MNAITYENTQTTLPNWGSKLHVDQGRGVAYETDTHFVHFYCRHSGWFTLSPGLTVTEQKNGTLADWVVTTFGAKDIQDITNAVGETSRGVWRPGLTMEEELNQGLGNDPVRMHSDLIALRLLLSALEKIFEFVEPSEQGLFSYGHKTRELLIAACTELENQWKRYFVEADCDSTGRDYNTNDYVKLCAALYLKEYQISARAYGSIPPIKPFVHWDADRPSHSLHWYKAYNDTKHNREDHFDKASVKNCIYAVAANIVMFCARYGPSSLFNDNGRTQTLFQQMFEIELLNFDNSSYYVPKLEIGTNQKTNIVCYDSFRDGQCQPWHHQKLIL